MASRRARLHALALRRRRAALNDPSRVTAPLTPRTLARERQAATRLRYGGQEQALAAQQAASQDLINRRIPAYFQDYLAAIQRAQQQTAGLYGRALSEQRQAAAEAQSQDASQNAALEQQLQADAAQRGASVDPSLARIAQRAVAARRASADTFGNLIGTLGANQGAFLANTEIVGAGQRLRALQGETNQLRNLLRQRQQLEGEKGAFGVDFARQQRELERKYQLEGQAFGLNVEKARQQARYQRSQARARRRSIALQRGALRERKRHNLQSEGLAAQRARRSGRSGGRRSEITPTQQRSAMKQFRRALAFAAGQPASPTRPAIAPVRPGQGHGFANYLGREKGIDPLLGLAAAEVFLYGGLTRRRWHQVYDTYGIKLPLRVSSRRVRRPPNAPSGRRGERRPT